MTPEERAKEIVNALLDTENEQDWLQLVRTHIHAAVEAERERADQLLLDLYDRGPQRGALGWAQAWGSGVLDAAAAIRAR